MDTKCQPIGEQWACQHLPVSSIQLLQIILLPGCFNYFCRNIEFSICGNIKKYFRRRSYFYKINLNFLDFPLACVGLIMSGGWNIYQVGDETDPASLRPQTPVALRHWEEAGWWSQVCCYWCIIDHITCVNRVLERWRTEQIGSRGLFKKWACLAYNLKYVT